MPASRSWDDDRGEPEQPYIAAPRRAYDSEPPAGYDAPGHFEESPRRSRRALEESARRAVEELARHVRDDQPAHPGDGADPLGVPAIWDGGQPIPRQQRDDAAGGSWRTRQTTELETWRSASVSAERWRSETVSWRSHETVDFDPSDRRDRPTIEVDLGGSGSVAPHAIGSGDSGAGGHARHADSADLEAWRSETGTWRTGDTATTGSWRLPPAVDDAQPLERDTGEWRAYPAPESGLWSRSRERWIPRPDDTGEQADFTVRRYDDTGEIPKDLLERARGRVVDHNGLGGSWPRGDDDGERRVGRRRAVDDDRSLDRPGDRAGEWRGRRAVDAFEDLSDQRHRGPADWAPSGGRGSRPALSGRIADVADGDRDGNQTPRGRFDDDVPRYRAGGRGVAGTRVGRHASDRIDDETERRPPRRAAAYAGPLRVADSVITPRAIAARGGLVRVDRRLAEADDEGEPEDVVYGYSGAGVAAVAWFGLPIGAFLLWAMFLGGTARADCVDAAGQPCAAPRDAAFATFAAHLPQVGVAIVLSVIVAMLIRLATPFWRPATVGFAAAVVGGGVATVLFTVMNGG